MTNSKSLIQSNPWQGLRAHTPARIALGRVGSSLPVKEVLRFGLEHARARDAVHRPLDVIALQSELESENFRTLRVRSLAPDRQTYLVRPDLGRRLYEDDRRHLDNEPATPQLAVVVADGLSSIAAQRHALPVLKLLREQFATDWDATAIVVAEQGRVALGDDIGEGLRAELVATFIGERPGLTSPDSLGIYLTFRPHVGRMDSERNCISNIRPEGLPYAQAAHKLCYLMREALRLGLTGVGLKDDSQLKPVESIDDWGRIKN
jgi:ethanolamine ammonia-lyase small subunit